MDREILHENARAESDARRRSTSAHRNLLEAVKGGVLSFLWDTNQSPDEETINRLVDESNAALRAERRAALEENDVD